MAADGSATYDAWHYNVESRSEDGTPSLRTLGTVALFGNTLLSDTSRVHMKTDGVLASLSFEQIEKLGATNQNLALRLTFFFGQGALRLSVALDWAQCADDPDERTEEPHPFSVPFDLALKTERANAMSLFDPECTHGLKTDGDDATLLASLECFYRHKLRRYGDEEGGGLDGMLTYLRDEVSVQWLT